MADALLMILAPLMPPHMEAAHVAHMTATLRSDISNRRFLATAVLPSLLRPLLSGDRAQVLPIMVLFRQQGDDIVV